MTTPASFLSDDDWAIEDALDRGCPNCGAMWSMDEIDRDLCYCCGYPDPDMQSDQEDENETL